MFLYTFCNIVRWFVKVDPQPEANALFGGTKTQKTVLNLCFWLCIHLEVFNFWKIPLMSGNGVSICDCDSLYHSYTPVQVGRLPEVCGCVRAELKCNSCGPVVGIHCELHQAILLAQITSLAPAPLRFKPSTAYSPVPLDSQAAVWQAGGQEGKQHGKKGPWLSLHISNKY